MYFFRTNNKRKDLKMIRTSKHILKYQTNSKTVSLEKLFNDYKLCLEYYIDLILSESN